MWDPRPAAARASRTWAARGSPTAAATAAPHPVLVPFGCAGCGVGVPQGRRGSARTFMRRRRHFPRASGGASAAPSGAALFPAARIMGPRQPLPGDPPRPDPGQPRTAVARSTAARAPGREHGRRFDDSGGGPRRGRQNHSLRSHLSPSCATTRRRLRPCCPRPGQLRTTRTAAPTFSTAEQPALPQRPPAARPWPSRSPPPSGTWSP